MVALLDTRSGFSSCGLPRCLDSSLPVFPWWTIKWFHGLILARGLEKVNVSLIGFKNSPSYAQGFMDRKLFKHRHFARAYIDDIIIFSNAAEEHIRHVEIILRLFKEVNLALSPTKSFIGYPSVKLLGFKVDAVG
jgi:hypothetical protein